LDIAYKNRDARSPIRVWQVVLVFVLLGAAAPIVAKIHLTGSASWGFIAVVGFTWINVMIALWEIALHLRIGLVEQQHQQFTREFSRGQELQQVFRFFTARLRPSDVLAPSTWAEVWSSYSLFDEAYANKKSFGFWVDTGNGFFTLLPALFFIYALTFEAVDPRIVGIVGLMFFWQMLYGTIIYFWAYICSGQYKGLSLGNLVAFVAGTNGLWMIFPAYVLYICVQFIMQNSYLVLH